MQSKLGRTYGPARFSFQHYYFWLFGLLLLMVTGLGVWLGLRAYTPVTGILEVVTEPGGQVIARLPSTAGDLFQLRYVHSVEQSEVVDYFRIEPDGSLLLEGTLYHSQGVGLPFDETGSATFTITPEGMLWQNLNRSMPALRLRTVEFTHHELLKDDQTIQLSDPRWAGTRLVVRARLGRIE